MQITQQREGRTRDTAQSCTEHLGLPQSSFPGAAPEAAWQSWHSPTPCSTWGSVLRLSWPCHAISSCRSQDIPGKCSWPLLVSKPPYQEAQISQLFATLMTRLVRGCSYSTHSGTVTCHQNINFFQHCHYHWGILVHFSMKGVANAPFATFHLFPRVHVRYSAVMKIIPVIRSSFISH